MAENIWRFYSNWLAMSKASYELAKECMRRSESCLYTSTSFFIWLRVLRNCRVAFAAIPLILGSLASWNLLTNVQDADLFIALCSFFAGLLPSIYLALKLDERLEESKTLAGEFKNLQDAYRQAALVSRYKEFAEFESEVAALNQRLEQARSESLTPPEWCFQCARWKIKAGDYSFDLDAEG